MWGSPPYAMATPVQNVPAARFSWRRPTTVFHYAPRALLWAALLGLLWAVVRPPLTLLAGMVRWQPTGSENMYLVGVGIGIAIDLAVYGFLVIFLMRRERWAQVGLVGIGVIQALYWGAQLARSSHSAVAVPENFPSFANPPVVGRDLMYALSALLPAIAAAAAAWPSLWRWTRREEPEVIVDDDAPA